MTAEANNNFKQMVVTNLVTLVVALMSSYFMFAGQQVNSETGVYSSTLERMRVQDEMISTLQEQISTANLRILELEGQVRREANHHDIVQSFIDSIPLPMWVKRLNAEGVFEIYLINKKYSETYHIGKSRYQGQTDFDVWPMSIAEKYQADDRAVFFSGGYMQTVSDIPVRGVGTGESPTKKFSVLKFGVDLPLGAQGVGGIVLGEAK
jgi:hypothetical protein